MRNKTTVLSVVLKVIKRRFKLSNLLFLAVLCSVNTFAWFIYMNKVDSDISVKVKAWNVSFQFDNESMTDYVDFDVSEIYPGIPDIVKSLKVSNDGDVAAELSYEIVYANVFGNVYDVSVGDITSSELEEYLLSNYPFKINVSFSNSILAGDGGEEMFIVTTTWPYETINDDNLETNDEIDTYWGNLAYDFKNENPDSNCIELKIKISATQIVS